MILLRPTIPYHSTPCRWPTPVGLTTAQGLTAHNENSVFSSLDLPGYPMKDGHDYSRDSDLPENEVMGVWKGMAMDSLK
jgi:hypothetical protein